jgi:hypothetical protein
MPWPRVASPHRCPGPVVAPELPTGTTTFRLTEIEGNDSA